jgi:hypothetical protein
LSQSDPTDQALAAIASILDQPASPPAQEAAAVDEKPGAPETAFEIVQEITSAPAVAEGYSRIGPGPLATVRLKWTVRREGDSAYYVDETMGDNSTPVVSGPMYGDEAVRLVNSREHEARVRFEKLKSQMSIPNIPSKIVDADRE